MEMEKFLKLPDISSTIIPKKTTVDSTHVPDNLALKKEELLLLEKQKKD